MNPLEKFFKDKIKNKREEQAPACHRCRFFDSVSDDLRTSGQCRRYAPRAGSSHEAWMADVLAEIAWFLSADHVTEDERKKLSCASEATEESNSWFPDVPGDYWCGEFVARPK